MCSKVFFLDHLLKADAIGLGRIVLSVQYPEQDFHEPETPIPSDEISCNNLEDFSYTVERTRGSGFQLYLSKLLTGARNRERGVNIDISSSLCVTRQLKNSGLVFERVCNSQSARKWMERAFRRRQDVYMVTGTRALLDASVGTQKSTNTELSGGFAIPTAQVAAAAGYTFPIGESLDVGLDSSKAKGDSERTSFTAKGEYVFAIEYRKVRFDMFSKRSVDNAYLAIGVHWNMLVGARGQTDEDVAIQAQLDEFVDDDLNEREFDSILLDGEEVFYPKYI
ncbi:hypothetical protein Daus18300_004530 [Diaporthe australafricana]|uniref:Uncharacterized protein n=1 Tax=Diaporthe australafricana TaxID=127596 RepID=A0ABR3X7H4_9PEZI